MACQPWPSHSSGGMGTASVFWCVFFSPWGWTRLSFLVPGDGLDYQRYFWLLMNLIIRFDYHWLSDYEVTQVTLSVWGNWYYHWSDYLIIAESLEFKPQIWRFYLKWITRDKHLENIQLKYVKSNLVLKMLQWSTWRISISVAICCNVPIFQSGALGCFSPGPNRWHDSRVTSESSATSSAKICRVPRYVKEKKRPRYNASFLVISDMVKSPLFKGGLFGLFAIPKW